MIDFKLWERVKRTIVPLGQATRRGDPRLVRVRESDTIDLHGYTIHGAHTAADRAIRQAVQNGRKNLTVITGRSGEICREFPEWVALHPDVRGCTSLNGGGAFLLRLRA